MELNFTSRCGHLEEMKLLGIFILSVFTVVGGFFQAIPPTELTSAVSISFTHVHHDVDHHADHESSGSAEAGHEDSENHTHEIMVSAAVAFFPVEKMPVLLRPSETMFPASVVIHPSLKFPINSIFRPPISGQI